MNARRVFFIGIGGSGMEPLAKFALQAGDRVAGSDSGMDDARFTKFEARGARIFREHSATNPDVLFADEVDANAPPIVVYSSAIAPEHIERARAQSLADQGAVRLMHRMDFLNDCLRESTQALCVAGTHGKTSSSSMAGWALLESGLDPHIIVGGRPLYLEDGVRFGKGRAAACETDESDGSFLKAAPGLRLVLNIDRDHLEHYGDFENLCAAFARFVAAGRLCMLNASDPELRNIGAAHSQSQKQTTSHAQPDIFYYHAGVDDEDPALTPFKTPSMTPPERTYTGRFAPNGDSMQVRLPGSREVVGTLQLKMPGRHFAGNALGVFALIDQAVRQGLLDFPGYDPGDLIKTLCEFPGVERRMQYLGRRAGAAVFDDYGHHPTEIEAVIAACRVRLGHGSNRGRLLAVFQPHRYTRTAALYREFARALGGADRVYLLPLYSAGEANPGGVDSAMIARELENTQAKDSAKNDAGAKTVRNFVVGDAQRGEALQNAFAEIFATVQADDLVVCLGAGDISAGIRAYLAATRE